MEIENYRPEKISPRDWGLIAPFVRDAVATAQAHYGGRYDTKDMLGAVAQHVRWVTQVACLPLESGVVFDRDSIHAYTAHGCSDLTPGTRGTRRSMLLRVAEAVLPDGQRVARLTPLHKDNPYAPYSEFEQRAMRSWAEGQRTASRRMDSRAVLALGLGAGLSTADILSLRAGDLMADHLGVLITVDRPSSRRDVPVLARWEQPLVDLLAVRQPEEWFIGVRRPGSNKNYLHNFLSTSRPESGQRPVIARLRNTWLVHHLTSGTPLGPLVAAAGLETFRTVEKLLPFLPEPTVEQTRREMRRALRSVG